jgi:hypothetical protein
MEDCFSNSLWIVQVSGHALRPYKCPCVLPTLYERFFKDNLGVCVVVYLDVILIYSDNPEERLKHVREVLRRLRVNYKYAKVVECAFSVDTTDLHGIIIGPDDLRMDTSKIQVICDWPTSRTSNRSWISQTSTNGLSPRIPISPSR